MGIGRSVGALEDQMERIPARVHIQKKRLHAVFPGVAHPQDLRLRLELLELRYGGAVGAQNEAIRFVHQRGKQCFLAAVVAIERAGRDPGRFHDIAQGSGLIAFFQKFRFRGCEDLFQCGQRQFSHGGLLYNGVISQRYILPAARICQAPGKFSRHIAHGASNYPMLFKRLLKEENQ